MLSVACLYYGSLDDGLEGKTLACQTIRRYSHMKQKGLTLKITYFTSFGMSLIFYYILNVA